MKNKHIKYYSSKAKETDDRVLEFVGSTEDIDRDHEVIKASGWRLKNYRKNPVVLVNHNPMNLPVAKTEKVWVVDKQLKFRIKFPEADVSPQGDTLYKLYKGGYMSATSVGFKPNFEKIVYGDTKLGQPRVTFKEQELLELSLVSIPANINAVVTARKGFKDAIDAEIVDELEIKDLEMWMKDLGFDLDNIKDEEPEEKDDLTNETPEKETEDINISEMKCDSCGVEISCLCSKCQELKTHNEYFQKILNDIFAERKEISADAKEKNSIPENE